MEDFMLPPGGVAPQQVPPMPGLPAPQILQEEGAQAPSQKQDGFFDKLRSDPKLTQAMLMTGLRMMQGTKPGQNTLGLVGDAMMTGAAAHNMLKHNEQEGARKDAEFAMRSQESGARVAQAQANTAATLQGTQQEAELFPVKKEKFAQEVKNLRTSGRTSEANALIAEFRAGNIKTETDLDNAVKQANIAQSNAAAGASSESTRGRKQENEWQATLADPKATAEQKQGAKEALRKGAEPYGNKLGEIDATAAALRKGNPTMTEQQAYSQAYNDLRGKKGQDVEVLKTLAENGDKDTSAWAQRELRALAEGATAARGGRVGVPAQAAGTVTWESARNSVPVGGTYTGPDNKQYVRTN